MNPLQSLREYEAFVYALPQQFAAVASSTTYPHHKHVPPDLKHHRIPAPGLSFTQPNIPLLIQEIEQILMNA